MSLAFNDVSDGRKTEMLFDIESVVLGGFTARDRASLDAHVEELRSLGVEPPSRIPAFWPMSTDRVTLGDQIEVQGNRTSGEIEFVLLFSESGVYVTVGSDQTDREFEVHSIPRSKQLCPKIIGRDVLPYEQLQGRWDELVLRSEVRVDGRWQSYQESALSAVMSVEDMVREAFGSSSAPVGTLLMSGTVPIVDAITHYADGFRGHLEVPGGQRLEIEYSITALAERPNADMAELQ